MQLYFESYKFSNFYGFFIFSEFFRFFMNLMNLKLIYLIQNQFYYRAGDVAKSRASDREINRDCRSSLKVEGGYVAQSYSSANHF